MQLTRSLRAALVAVLLSLGALGGASCSPPPAYAAPAVVQVQAQAAPDTARVNVMHTSVLYSLTPAQHRHDVRKIFGRAVDRKVRWVTGTEAGEPQLRRILVRIGGKAGYRFHFVRDNWVAVQRDFIAGGWREGQIFVVDTSQTAGKGHDSIAATVAFDTEQLGRIHIAAGHYPTKGRTPADPNYRWTKLYAERVSDWAVRQARGSDLVFYGGDQNIPDDKQDTFRGGPLTSTWDELRRWQGTGHGCIDLSASYDGDRRTEAAFVRSLPDRRFFLFSDHLAVESGYRVEKLGRAA